MDELHQALTRNKCIQEGGIILLLKLLQTKLQMLPSLLKFDNMGFPSLKKLHFAQSGKQEAFYLLKKNSKKLQDLPFKPTFFLDQAKIILRVVFINLNDQL